MHPLRRRAGSTSRGAAVEHDREADAAIVRSFADDITEACIDLIDLPLDIDAQKRVIQLLLHDAPTAEQAITRLNNVPVPH